MGEQIKNLYREKGLTPPVGKGEHTMAFHREATSIMADNPSMPKSEAYAISMKDLGRNKAVNKSHWRSAIERKVSEA